MRFSLAFLKKNNPVNKIKGLTDADLILAGGVVLLCVLIGLVAVDAYIFYTVYRHERGENKLPASEVTISSAQIDGIINLLDQRATEYQRILSGK